MSLTKEDKTCLIAYSREPENLPLALAIGAIQDDLKVAIITEFLKELQKYVKDGLQRKNLPWCVTTCLEQSKWKENSLIQAVMGKEDIQILLIGRKGSNRKVVLHQWKGWEIYLGGKCDDESTLKCEKLELALVEVGIGFDGYNEDGFEWWGFDRDLGSDETEALTTMNVENDRKELLDHYGGVLLKAVEVTENLL